MKRSRIVLVGLLVLACAGAGAWIALATGHRHALEPHTDPQGKTYYTCPMHPQVRQDQPGNCPICGMTLVRKEEPPTAGRQVLYWYDPMKPDAHFDQPGKSPFMDMQLVPKYAAGDDGGNRGIVEIDPRMVQNLGIRTARVERGALSSGLDAVGSVDIDERRVFAVESRAAGWVEQLLVRAVGEPVTRGQRLAGVYSPELFAAQQELALAARSGDAALLAASRQRLGLLGLAPDQAEQVIRSGAAQRQVAIVAPSDGVVTELNVRQGQQVMPGAPLMRVADLSQVWVTVEIPEAQGASVALGGSAQVRLPGLRGKTFAGTIEHIYPRLDTQTRTLRARIALDNPDLLLKPGMFAQVTLPGVASTGTLLVPSEAVIRTGTRDVVILAEGQGRFRPALVSVGQEHAGQTGILGGLAEGETVVVSGQFLIDSEASLQGALARMGAEPVEPAP
ncbi:MAG TPA: efflux RND transporter periplasmic adaptor subunit [Solimonas sp.]|nr:efflux RND transporter periplasmic adaptor subunit [Solimonas sp.]